MAPKSAAESYTEEIEVFCEHHLRDINDLLRDATSYREMVRRICPHLKKLSKRTGIALETLAREAIITAIARDLIARMSEVRTLMSFKGHAMFSVLDCNKTDPKDLLDIYHANYPSLRPFLQEEFSMPQDVVDRIVFYLEDLRKGERPLK